MQDGQFYLGHTGGGGRLAYSILGDPANTAARLESLNKQLGTHILAADSVLAGLDEVLTRPLGRFQLGKGRAEASSPRLLALAAEATPRVRSICARASPRAVRRVPGHAGGEARELFEGDPRELAEDDGPARFYIAALRADPSRGRART